MSQIVSAEIDTLITDIDNFRPPYGVIAMDYHCLHIQKSKRELDKDSDEKQLRLALY